MFALATSAVDALANSPPTDLARLLAVPVFAWAAYRDIATRRVPNKTWLPLAALGVLLLAVDGWQALGADAYQQQRFFLHAAISVGLVAPLGYVFWRVGGFGGADAKAVMVLAILFPAFPTYYLPATTLPVARPYVGVFSLSVLSNTVLLGVAYPFVLAARNLARGRVGLPMFVGKPVPVEDLPYEYGRILEGPDGLTRGGLDLDALRMYLRWRDLTLAEVRATPERYRDPRSLPPEDERHDPTDGALAAGPDVAGDPTQEPAPTPAVRTADPDDPWGAATFLASIEGSAYGTTPEALREGLEVVAREDAVWVTPGVPFIVPMFAGLLVGLTYGDLLFVLMQAAGLLP